MNACVTEHLRRCTDLIAAIEDELHAGTYNRVNAMRRIAEYLNSTKTCQPGEYYAARPMLHFLGVLPTSDGEEAKREYQTAFIPTRITS